MLATLILIAFCEFRQVFYGGNHVAWEQRGGGVTDRGGWAHLAGFQEVMTRGSEAAAAGPRLPPQPPSVQPEAGIASGPPPDANGGDFIWKQSGGQKGRARDTCVAV